VQPPRSQHEQYFFVITGVPGYQSKRIYIGSTKTITQDRIDKRWTYAQELRAQWVQGLELD
ncbi:hypothetical protein, partial [Vibrio vulnificus]|uniref:hypothetical protein n=1 Tax=Vibrio vulnificus TaxID=672 RepID=UPI0039B6AAAB